MKPVNPYFIPVQRLRHNHIIMRQEKRAMRKNIPGTHTRGVLGRCWVVDRIGQGGVKINWALCVGGESRPRSVVSAPPPPFGDTRWVYGYGWHFRSILKQLRIKGCWLLLHYDELLYYSIHTNIKSFFLLKLQSF